MGGADKDGRVRRLWGARGWGDCACASAIWSHLERFEGCLDHFGRAYEHVFGACIDSVLENLCPVAHIYAAHMVDILQ